MPHGGRSGQYAGAGRRLDAFRIQGVLDFSLVGILSEITGILAEDKIGIFAISTFNTDYILTKKEDYQKALDLLDAEGYKILE